jgi:(p)ppGpp synthase/HD superfamily hydrolase
MSIETKAHLILSKRFTEALKYAITWHGDQARTSTEIPYIAHPLGVASLILEAMGDEDQVIAALLLDIADDCGGEERLTEISLLFGERVAQIVRGCSRSLVKTEDGRGSRNQTGEEYFKQLSSASHDVLLLTAADKLHNARAIATDLQTLGTDVWKRFKAGKAAIVWHYESVLKILEGARISPTLLNPLRTAIGIMKS